MQNPSLPIGECLPALIASLERHPRLVLEAPPGAGKTTQVPLALLAASWRGDGRIVMLEPRRLAARAAARFMARALGEEVGDRVGYRIRFEQVVSAATRIEVVTEGILTRMIQEDPSLEGVAAVLFDEFHERHLSCDLGLALALDVQAQLRPDLRLVLMSATLDGERLAAWLDAPRLYIAGRTYPVQIAHFPLRHGESELAQLCRCIHHALAAHPGDLLVFLPGRREIAAAERALADLAPTVKVLPLHGDLPIEAQSLALAPDAQGLRRIVLASNVAESSVTLPGVRVVIDSGLAREPRFDPNSGFSRLATVRIAESSAEQRAGRAGRVAEGWCYRLWPRSLRLEPERRPEIAQVDLASLALELAAWGSSDLRWLDPPPTGALAAGRDLLRELGALDADFGLTAFGRRLLALGTHPRLAAMLLAVDGEAQALACDLAALLEARDPLRLRNDALAARWDALAAFRCGRLPAEASRSALAAIDTAAQQWRRRLRCGARAPAQVPAYALGNLLAHAFPDRIARQHAHDPLRYQLANGRGARLLADRSALYGEPWLSIADLRHETGEALILRAAPLDPAYLQRAFAARFRSTEVVRWDVQAGALQCRREECFGRIVLASKPAGRPDPERAAVALCDAVGELGLDALPWTQSLRQWRERVLCLRQWMPELGLPDLSDPALLAARAEWLLPVLRGKTRLDALTEDELRRALQDRIAWPLRQRIDALAPRCIRVPSGRERPISYTLGSAPVLAVQLQELFGLAETPRIADGRIALILHLLSPGGKPLQVTQDLASFWARTYPEVKKEMKGRYPRHPWPDDPWTAIPTHRAKPRGQ